jgi:hypothetical protein
MKTTHHRTKTTHPLTLALALVLLSTAGCAGESDQASLTRIAAKLRPGDVKVVTDKEGAAAPSSADQIPDASGIAQSLIRTSAPDWQTSYSLSHAVLARPDLKDDVAKWGVVAVLKDKDGNVIDSFQQRGLDGQALLSFKDGVGNFTIEFNAYEFVRNAPQDPLGAPTVFRIFRDTQGPRIGLEVSAAEDLDSKIIRLTPSVTIKDEDAEPPTCSHVEFLTASESVLAKVALAPTGKEWEQGEEAGSWKLSAKVDTNLLDGMPASSRLDCADPTGNTSSIVVALASATRAEVLPQIQFSPLGRSVSAIPRLAADDTPRVFLLENRKVSFDMTLRSQGKTISDPEVVEKKRNELTMLVEAKLASAPEDEPARVIWSGAPELTKTFELPASLIGNVDLKVTIRDTLAGSSDAPALLANTYRLYVAPSVTPALELIQPDSLAPAIRNRTVNLSARAVTAGLRYGQSDFPDLEMTQDGTTWTAVQAVSFNVTRTEAQATGAEIWTLSFPYPFDDEKPLRLRLKGEPEAGNPIISNTSKRIFGSPALTEDLPPIGDPSRLSCGASQSKLNVKLASKVACTTGTGANARISLALENLGRSDFALSTPAANLSYAIVSGTTSSFAQISGGQAILNQGGLLGRSIITIEVPKSLIPTQGSAVVELEFDRIEQGGHSLAPLSFCYDINSRPKLTLSSSDLVLSNFVCDDEF